MFYFLPARNSNPWDVAVKNWAILFFCNFPNPAERPKGFARPRQTRYEIDWHYFLEGASFRTRSLFRLRNKSFIVIAEMIIEI